MRFRVRRGMTKGRCLLGLGLQPVYLSLAPFVEGDRLAWQLLRHGVGRVDRRGIEGGTTHENRDTLLPGVTSRTARRPCGGRTHRGIRRRPGDDHACERRKGTLRGHRRRTGSLLQIEDQASRQPRRGGGEPRHLITGRRARWPDTWYAHQHKLIDPCRGMRTGSPELATRAYFVRGSRSTRCVLAPIRFRNAPIVWVGALWVMQIRKVTIIGGSRRMRLKSRATDHKVCSGRPGVYTSGPIA